MAFERTRSLAKRSFNIATGGGMTLFGARLLVDAVTNNVETTSGLHRTPSEIAVMVTETLGSAALIGLGAILVTRAITPEETKPDAQEHNALTR